MDSRYPTPTFLFGLQDYSNLVMIARVRKNRIVYRQPDAGTHKTRPRWYGEPIDLRDATTWPPLTEHTSLTLTRKGGEPTTLKLWRWSNLLMRGTREHPMHQCPFDLVGIQRLDADGSPLGSPLWLLVWGQHRSTLCLTEVRHFYSQRFNLEHFFGFAKSHLLLDAAQTCQTPSEINAVRLACLAYAQRWLARQLVDTLPLPWQRYGSQAQSQQLTPRRVQRGFARLIRQIGSIAAPSKPRGRSPGRAKGTQLSPRPPCPLVKFRPPRKRCPCKETQIAG